MTWVTPPPPSPTELASLIRRLLGNVPEPRKAPGVRTRTFRKTGTSFIGSGCPCRLMVLDELFIVFRSGLICNFCGRFSFGREYLGNFWGSFSGSKGDSALDCCCETWESSNAGCWNWIQNGCLWDGLILGFFVLMEVGELTPVKYSTSYLFSELYIYKDKLF